MAERARRPWRRWGWGIGALAVAAGAGTFIAESVSSGATGYRTTDATTASVSSTLTLTGSVVPVERATAVFGVSGTVASVAVSVGQQVNAGETLATLTPTALQRAVTSAQAKLTAAEATLATDESAQASTSAAGTGASSESGSTASGSGSGGTAAVHTAQQAVVAAQQTADHAGQSATAALSAADTACGAASPTGTGGGAGTGSATPGGARSATGGSAQSTAAATAGGGTGGSSTSPTPGGSASSTGAPTTAAACKSALTAALAAQTQVSTDQRAVTRAETSLAGLLTKAASGSTQTKAATAGASASSAAGRAGSTASNSPATLATDQATIDTDRATLITAQQSLAAAQLTSPITGTVAAVGLSVGEKVASGSTTTVVTVINAGSYQATGSLTSSQVPSVKVGDGATMTVAGTNRVLHGTVTRVGPVDVGAGNTYPLVVTLAPGTGAIFTGSSAQISVVTARASHVLVVPTSAVHLSGAAHAYVLTVSKGHEARTTVTLGVMGAVYTQVTAGLRDGDAVVLADLAQAVPAATTTLTGRFGGGRRLAGLGGGKRALRAAIRAAG